MGVLLFFWGREAIIRYEDLKFIKILVNLHVIKFLSHYLN